MVWLALGLLIAFVVYVIAGYPLLLGWWARRRERPVARAFSGSFEAPDVSVLLATHNGAKYLDAKLASLQALDYPAERIEILVLSDGSTDDSEIIARRRAAGDPRIRWIALPKRGKWAALNAGLELARGEILLFTDARQPLAPDALHRMVACYADPAVGCVSGELVIREGASGEEAQTGLYWRYEKFIRRGQSALDSVIGATGAIYTQRKSLCRPLPPDTLLDDVHIPLQAFFAGYRVILESGAYAYDDPTRLDREFHRKVRTLAGNYQIIGRFPALLGPRNRMWPHFYSHKAGRLLLPFALLGIFALSVYLQAWSLVALQLGLPAIALLDFVLPEGHFLKRLSSAARTFMVLMAATFRAASILYRPAKDFWR